MRPEHEEAAVRAVRNDGLVILKDVGDLEHVEVLRERTLADLPVGNNGVPIELREKRRAEVPPIQPTMQRGSVLIRDIRLWHNGMPNRTASARPMIAMIHWIHWWHDRNPILFPKGTEAFLE